MKISLFNNFGALNSVPVFAAFDQGLHALGIQSNSHDIDADVAVIWSHLWSGRMRHNREIWTQVRYTFTTLASRRKHRDCCTTR